MTEVGVSDLRPSARILMGPGPSNVHPRVLRAMATPLVGHLDPEFLQILNETKALLQQVMQTRNDLTLPISGTGSAGMEACLTNLIEPGDTVIVGINGLFGTRMADISHRCGATVVPVEAPWGSTIDPEDVSRALADTRAKLVAIVHAETSTGVIQPLTEVSRLAHDYGALLVVDAVTSLGGFPVDVDAWGIDAVYSGTQKCLSCPPGLAPLSFGERAVRALDGRRTPVQSWYLDLTMVRRYWEAERFYHHTAPISMIYALREALRIILEEGLDARLARHRRNHLALVAGLGAIGLELLPAEGRRLWTLNAVRVPAGVEELTIRRRLLAHYNIEIGGGVGELQGTIWRVGLMGESSTQNNVLLLLAALADCLKAEGHPADAGAAVAAALEVYGK